MSIPEEIQVQLDGLEELAAMTATAVASLKASLKANIEANVVTPEATVEPAAPEAPAAPEPEAAATEPQYEPTEKMEGFTIEQYLSNGWKLEQLIKQQMVVEVFATPEPETAPEPPAPDAPKEDAAPVMTAKAGATTFQQFIDRGWSEAQLVDGGYMEAPAAPELETPAPPAPASTGETKAVKDADGNWVSPAGEVFDEAQHGKPKDFATGGAPSVNGNGTFKKKRNSSKPAPKVEAPAAAPEAPKEDAAPPPPPAGEDAAPPPPDVDPELDALIKDFNA